MSAPLLASIPSPPINGIDIGPLTLNFYGVMIGIGVGLGWWMTTKRFEAMGGDRVRVEKILFRMIIFGFLGARLAYVSTNLSRFEGEWWKVIAIWEGGLALFGGLTAGAITVYVLCRRWGVDLWTLLDSLAPAVPLAQGFGRWGNYFNQELFGTPSTLPWAVEIDAAHRSAEYARFATFHPTFLYESIWNLALSVTIIWLAKRYPSLEGKLIGIYFVGYAVMRFLLELIRTDTAFRFLELSRNGWVSIDVVLLGLVILIRPARSMLRIVDAPAGRTS